jgi:hypothetical protein
MGLEILHHAEIWTIRIAHLYGRGGRVELGAAHGNRMEICCSTRGRAKFIYFEAISGKKNHLWMHPVKKPFMDAPPVQKKPLMDARPVQKKTIYGCAPGPKKTIYGCAPGPKKEFSCTRIK